MGYQGDLRLALELVNQVASYTTEHFLSGDFHVSEKPDRTLVSEIDRNCESMLRKALAAHRPQDVIFGEEFGSSVNDDLSRSDGKPSRRWIIDPIDATNNFIRGVPVWATLLALEDQGEVVVGVVSAPMLKRTWYAAKGEGSWLKVEGQPVKKLQVSEVTELSDAFFSYSSLAGWQSRNCLPNFIDFIDGVWRSRAFGDFWSHLLVAEGAVDIAAEPELELYDMAALYPIVTEAGGVFTDLHGNDGPWGGNALVANSHLHKKALAKLGNLF